MTTYYRVISSCYSGPVLKNRHVSEGFSSRQAAERFAAGLAAAGRCDSVLIEAYEAEGQP